MVQDMVKFEERERQNLSFQVHNQMGQDLSALKMYLGILESKTGKLEEVEESKNILNRLINTMHDISELLCPPGLDEIGLVSMMEGLIESYRKLTGAVFEFKKPQAELNISREYSLTIYRIAQETLNNIAKYSKAGKVNMALTSGADHVELRIQDDGIGFDYEGLSRNPGRRKTDKAQLGILALKERVEILEGTMQIKTAPGQGVLIVVCLPCKNNV
jgi:signal transduction histidine kinase